MIFFPFLLWSFASRLCEICRSIVMYHYWYFFCLNGGFSTRFRSVVLYLFSSTVGEKLQMRRVRAARRSGGLDGEAPVNDDSFVAQPKEAVSADQVIRCATRR